MSAQPEDGVKTDVEGTSFALSVPLDCSEQAKAHLHALRTLGCIVERRSMVPWRASDSVLAYNSDTEEGENVDVRDSNPCWVCQALRFPSERKTLGADIKSGGSYRAAMRMWAGGAWVRRADATTEISTSGPAHAQQYNATLRWGCNVVAHGKGSRRREAMENALTAFVTLHLDGKGHA